MSKAEWIQTGKHILLLAGYLAVVGLITLGLTYLELHQSHAPSDTGVPSNIFDGVFAFFFSIILLFLAILMWMRRIGKMMSGKGFSNTFFVINRFIQWLPIVVLTSLVVVMVSMIVLNFT